MEAERQRDIVQVQIQDSCTAESSGSPNHALDAAGDMAKMRQQMELLNRRINELETTQRDMEIYANRLLVDVSPPDYSTSADRAI